MPRKRNPLKAVPISVTIKGSARRRPKPFPSDDDLRALLSLWAISFPLPPAFQEAINFRLLDILQKRRVALTPMKQALSDVAILTTGMLGADWSETHACNEAARIRGVDKESLMREWRRHKNRPA